MPIEPNGMILISPVQGEAVNGSHVIQILQEVVDDVLLDEDLDFDFFLRVEASIVLLVVII